MFGECRDRAVDWASLRLWAVPFERGEGRRGELVLEGVAMIIMSKGTVIESAKAGFAPGHRPLEDTHQHFLGLGSSTTSPKCDKSMVGGSIY